MPYDVTADLDGPARGRIEPATYVALIESVLAAEGIEDGALTLLFAGDELLWRLNREHRDVDAPTDVLSFADDDDEPMPTDAGESTYIGDIAVSIEMAARQAGDAGLTVEEELSLRGLVEQPEDVKKSRLSRARGADHRHPVSRGEAQVHTLENLDPVAPFVVMANESPHLDRYAAYRAHS